MENKFNTFTVTIKDSIGFIQLNRPKRLNALSSEMLRELAEVAHWLDKQLAVKVVLISGAGRAFSAGADLNDPFTETTGDKSWIERRDKAQYGLRMTQAISSMRAITIAQVHGFAIGGAFLLMLACDFRVAEEKAFFSIPEVDLGIPLSWGGIPTLVAEIGPTRTKDLVMTCRRFYAPEAKSLGLLTASVPQEKLAAHCLDLAETLANKPALPLLMTKEQVNAVTQHIGAAYVASAEGDMLQSLQKDPESLKAAQAYLKKNLRK